MLIQLSFFCVSQAWGLCIKTDASRLGFLDHHTCCPVARTGSLDHDTDTACCSLVRISSLHGHILAVCIVWAVGAGWLDLRGSEEWRLRGEPLCTAGAGWAEACVMTAARLCSERLPAHTGNLQPSRPAQLLPALHSEPRVWHCGQALLASLISVFGHLEHARGASAMMSDELSNAV